MRGERRSTNILQGLCNFSLSYDIEVAKPISCSLMLPITFLHFGEFEALTLPLFAKKWKKVEAKVKTDLCAVDKDII